MYLDQCCILLFFLYLFWIDVNSNGYGLAFFFVLILVLQEGDKDLAGFYDLILSIISMEIVLRD